MRIWFSVFVGTVAAAAVLLAPAPLYGQAASKWVQDEAGCYRAPRTLEKDLIRYPADQGVAPRS